MSEELYFNDELRKCLDAAGLSDCGENDVWNYWYQRVHKAHDQAIDRVTKVQRVENAKLRKASAIYEEVIQGYVAENARLFELLQRTWDAFHGATAREFVAVKNELRELGVEVDE